MVRNILLAVSTLAVLVVLLFVYTALVGKPVAQREPDSVLDDLPPQTQDVEPLRIGQDQVELPPGGKIVVRRFDERTGRPTDVLEFADWRPVPGSKKEVIVSEPELHLLLPTGMVVTISADEGQIAADRIEQSQAQLKQGQLRGNVRVILDRNTDVERTPRETRPADVVTIAVDEVDFDLEVGALRTAGRLTVACPEFEIAGTGLQLVWNDADNRIDTLRIEQGERFVLYGLSDLVRSTTPPPPAAASAPAAVAQTPAPTPSAAGAVTTYECTLGGPVLVTQFRADQAVGSVRAAELALLFDVGGHAGRALQSPSPASAPATQPDPSSRDRLVLTWTGPLELHPRPSRPRTPENRRHITLRGDPVVLTRGDGSVRCGELRYHDETQRIWLRPVAGDVVHFELGPELAAEAAAVYIDRHANLVKLIGDVWLHTRHAGDPSRPPVSQIRSAYWAVLRLSPGGAASDAVLGDSVDAGQLESATFVGDVLVDLGPQTLTSHQLDVTFANDTGAEHPTFEQMLDTAVASGSVMLSSDNGSLACARLDLAFDVGPDDALYPSEMIAVGSVRFTRGRARAGGDRVVALLAPPPESDAPNPPAFVLRQIDLLGRAELIEPDDKVAARGQRISATFEGLNWLRTATVQGTDDAFGALYRHPYLVRAARADLDREALTLHVDGPSQVSFKARRSLQGRRRTASTPINIDSTRVFHVDGRRNTVRFEGEVVARSGTETLAADTLTLLLEDVATEADEEPPPTLRHPLHELWRQTYGWWNTFPPGTAQSPDPLAVALGPDVERMRKEPLRLVADNALMASEAYTPGGALPVMHASVSAPLLEVDIIGRQILTTGLTQLLMINRQEVLETGPVEVATGIPSALISRGASQTAMQCQGRMVYTLGPDGPARRDTALFDDDVVFVHRTGQEMVNLEEMLPRLADYPNLLDGVQSRNATLNCDRLECWFEAVDPDGADPLRAGGLAAAPLRLASLIASRGVYLRDQESSHIREVNANWIEFSREFGRLDVRGAEGAQARVYFEDLQRQEFDFHSGERIVISLSDGTIRSTGMTGEFRRP